jgi:hypothetical protein
VAHFSVKKPAPVWVKINMDIGYRAPVWLQPEAGTSSYLVQRFHQGNAQIALATWRG